MQQLNRVNRDLLAPGAYQTYSITQRPDVLLRAACEQVGCAAWANGWESHIDESTPLGQQQAAYIRQRSGRTFRETRTGPGITVFRFEAHQRCFAEHQTRPQLYAVRGGDHREVAGPTRTHTRPADWVEDFGEHQQALAEQQQKG